MKKILAFDLDETLGVPIINGSSIVGFRIRDGCIALLDRLFSDYTLVLWTVGNRRYAHTLLSFGLQRFFERVFSWDDFPTPWKDIRKIGADFLIDDSPHHRDEAAKHGLFNGYIVICGYGSIEDRTDPLLWVTQIENGLRLL